MRRRSQLAANPAAQAKAAAGKGGSPRPFDFAAQAIDPATGAPAARGGVPAAETLLAAGKTLCAAAGLSREATETSVAGGRVIEAALRPA